MKTQKIAAIMTGLVLSAHAVPTSFSNTLKGYNGQNIGSDAQFLAASGFEPTTIGFTPAIAFGANGAKFGQFIAAPVGFKEGRESQNFLGKTKQCFGTISYFNFVTVQRDFVQRDSLHGEGAIYIGLGSATGHFFTTPVDGDGACFSQTSTFFRWQANPYISWHAVLNDQTDNGVPELGFEDELLVGAPPERRQGTTRLSMTYDPVAKTISDGVNYDFDHAFVPDPTSGVLDVTALVHEFPAVEGSSIYSGSNAGGLFSDSSVVPLFGWSAAVTSELQVNRKQSLFSTALLEKSRLSAQQEFH